MIDYSDYIKKTWVLIGGGDRKDITLSYEQVSWIIIDAATHQHELITRGVHGIIIEGYLGKSEK